MLIAAFLLGISKFTILSKQLGLVFLENRETIAPFYLAFADSIIFYSFSFKTLPSLIKSWLLHFFPKNYLIDDTWFIWQRIFSWAGKKRMKYNRKSFTKTTV